MRIGTYDFETNNADPAVCEPVEVSILDADTEESVFHSRLKPVGEISEQATAVHGISREELMHAPTPAQVKSKIVAAMSQFDVIVGFNNHHFDDNIWKRFFGPLPVPSVDLFRWVVASEEHERSSYKLTSLYQEEFGDIDEARTHAADYDCIMLARLLKHYKLDIEAVIEQQKGAIAFKVMPFGKYAGWKVYKVPNGYIKFMLEKANATGDLGHTLETERERRIAARRRRAIR